ncbi:hypothetical protein D6C91_07182 [Aureobasidium pullulans]|uniref:Uncharacterized protein n=1 Tax=Aureobasidium pullulans TaxID=5580 RepID=A0A4S9SS52_AURPU|nr:hypothetical protein D6C91_07182 [Aureobasidium pullulans]
MAESALLNAPEHLRITIKTTVSSPHDFFARAHHKSQLATTATSFQDLHNNGARSFARRPASARSTRSARSVRFQDEVPLADQSPSTRSAPAQHDDDDPTMMSGGLSGFAPASAAAGSPYVRAGPTDDPVARRRADRLAEEDRLASLRRNEEEYDLLSGASSARRRRDTATPRSLERISLADRTRRPYGPVSEERRRRERPADEAAQRAAEDAEEAEEESLAAHFLKLNTLAVSPRPHRLALPILLSSAPSSKISVKFKTGLDHADKEFKLQYILTPTTAGSFSCLKVRIGTTYPLPGHKATDCHSLFNDSDGECHRKARAWSDLNALHQV